MPDTQSGAEEGGMMVGTAWKQSDFQMGHLSWFNADPEGHEGREGDKDMLRLLRGREGEPPRRTQARTAGARRHWSGKDQGREDQGCAAQCKCLDT